MVHKTIYVGTPNNDSGIHQNRRKCPLEQQKMKCYISLTDIYSLDGSYMGRQVYLVLKARPISNSQTRGSLFQGGETN